MKKILYIINSLALGGAENHLLQLCENLDKKKYNIQICTIYNDVNDGTPKIINRLKKQKIKIFYLKFEKEKNINILFSIFSIIKIIKDQKYDLIHTHLPRSDFIGGIIKLRFPKVIWISTFHDAYIKGVYSGYKVLYFLKYLYYKADKIIVVSDYVKTWAIRKLSISEQKLFEIQHGINIKKVTRKTKSNKNINLGCLARFEKRKGIDKLIKVMPEILKIRKETRLYIAGNDPFGYKNKLQNKIKKLKLEENIFLKSFTNEPDKFLKKIDIYVYPSVAEGFGLTILEALNNKLPVICFDISPLNRIIIDKENGFLVKPFDLEDFKNKILELIKNKKLRKKLSNHGNKYLIDNFSINTMISKVENLYN